MAGTLTYQDGGSHLYGTTTAGLTNASSVTLATVGNNHNKASTTTSATPNTWTAVQMGSVSAGSAHWCFIENLSAVDTIVVAYDDDGTDIICDIPTGGPNLQLKAAGQVYVKCTGTASVPYASLVADA